MSELENKVCGERSGDCCQESQAMSRPVFWLQSITIGWMLAECGISLYAALGSRSLALFVFGADSVVELLSAVVVLLQFVPRFAISKHLAERAAAILLFMLALAVVCIAVAKWNAPKETSFLGMCITAAALLAMPVLAWLKRRQAGKLNNRALAADAAQSAMCAYLAAVTLAGLVAFAVWNVAWFDTVAALAAVPIVLIEAKRAWRGEGCC